MTLEEQLEHGIRFIDIRLRHIGNSFTIHHGPFFTGVSFGEVLEVTKKYLLGETIIMRLKNKYTREIECTMRHLKSSMRLIKILFL